MWIDFSFMLNDEVVYVEAEINVEFDDDGNRLNNVLQYFVDDDNGNQFIELSESDKEEILEAINNEVAYKDATDFVDDRLWD